MVVVLLITLFTTRIVLQGLGVVDYGVYNVVCGFVVMFGFLNTSMSNGIQRFMNYELSKNGIRAANKVFCNALFIQASLAVLVVAIVEPIGIWYLNNKMVIPNNRLYAASWIFQFAVLNFVVGIMKAPFSAVVTAHERMDFYAMLSMLKAVLDLAIAYIIIGIQTDKLIIYGLLMSCVFLIDLLFFVCYCKINFEECRFRKSFDVILFKKMLGFSGWNLFGSVAGVAENHGINLILNFFFGPVVNAARGIATQVNGGISAFVSNITMPVRPQVIHSFAVGNLKRTMNLTYTISKMSCFFLFMLAIPISLEIDFVLKLWLSDNVPDYAGIFTILVLMDAIVHNLSSTASTVVHASGIMRNYQLWGSAFKISAIPITIVILQIYERPELALLIVFLCDVFAHTACLFVMKRIVSLSLREYFSRVIVPIIGVFISSLCLISPFHYFLSEGFERLIIVTFCSIVIVFSMCLLFGISPKEKEVILQLIKSMLHKIKKK